jgi:hypothetical protein
MTKARVIPRTPSFSGGCGTTLPGAERPIRPGFDTAVDEDIT